MLRTAIKELCRKLLEKNCSGDIEYISIEENERLSVCGIDSFAYVMVYAEISSLFDISNDKFEENLPKGDVVFGDLLNFIETNKTKEPSEEEIQDACN
jgi:acyl carrier protein